MLITITSSSALFSTCPFRINKSVFWLAAVELQAWSPVLHARKGGNAT